jgi:O-Antigen ligase
VSGPRAAAALAEPESPRQLPAAGPPEAASAPAVGAPDAFPRTRRPLPWVLAGFLGMLFLVPIDSTELKVHLPVDSRIDRLAVLLVVLAWMWLGGDRKAFVRSGRSRLFPAAATIFLLIAVASLLLDMERIVNMGELNLAFKRFALLGSFLLISWFAMVALRFRDMRGMASYLIGLGTVMACGILVERHSGYNAFYSISATVLKPIATVAPAPTVIHPAYGTDGRVVVVGPTVHGLAATTMLMVVMPFALVRVLEAGSRRTWLLNACAFALMLGAAAATDRKSALVVPVAVVAYLAWYRRRQVLRLAPIGLVLLVGLVHLASPGALGTLLSSEAVEGSSTTHRLADFTDVAPDILAHPVLGRGFGTLDPELTTFFRINDNEYIDELWEVGLIGLAAYLAMIAAPVVAARKSIRAGEPDVAPLALAASAGCIAYLVANALFDAMSFPQAPYMFFIVAALTTVAVGGREADLVEGEREAELSGETDLRGRARRRRRRPRPGRAPRRR